MAGGTVGGLPIGLIVVLDASTIVSATLRRGSVPERAVERALGFDNRTVLSPEVAREYREVLSRPKFDRYATLANRMLFLERVLQAARHVEPEVLVRECADPADDKYLSLAAAGRADVIVTGDKAHLLAMDPWRGVRILSPAAFLAD